MSRSSFYKIPPEIWERILKQVGRGGLAALALTSKETYPAANRLLYKSLEISFCKCSESYYDALARTILNNPDLAALITHLFIDMKAPCRVKTATSAGSLQVARPWSHFRPYVILSGMLDHSRYSGPKGQADWSREAVQTLDNLCFLDILSKLCNLEKITVILGHFQQNSEVLSSMLTRLPANVLPSLRYLKVYDASLVSIRCLSSASSLRILDLGYVSVDNAELCAVVSRNARSLEELRLQWIMESSQTPLFADYPGDAISNLKAFASQGPFVFSHSGLKKLLGRAPLLEELRLESQSVPSATVWSQIFSDLTEDDTWKVESMRMLNFGASTGCREFWDSVVKFLHRCGDQLISLYINGTSRGSIGPFPPGLLNYFSNHPQPELARLALIWRDDTGFSPESAIVLGSFAPSLEMFHACLRLPANVVDTLLSMTAPFHELRRVHLIFLKFRQIQAMRDSEVFVDNISNIVRNGPIFEDFVRSAAAQHHELSEVSWGIYDRVTYSGNGPQAYIHRSPPTIPNLPPSENKPCITLEDLGQECRKFESMEARRFRCTVGTKKVLLNQKPSWREDMGNPFLESHRICQYAEFNAVIEERPQRREL